MLRTVMFVLFVQVSQVGLSVIQYLLDWGMGCEGAMSEKKSPIHHTVSYTIRLELWA